MKTRSTYADIRDALGPFSDPDRDLAGDITYLREELERTQGILEGGIRYRREELRRAKADTGFLRRALEGTQADLAMAQAALKDTRRRLVREQGTCGALEDLLMASREDKEGLKATKEELGQGGTTAHYVYRKLRDALPEHLQGAVARTYLGYKAAAEDTGDVFKFVVDLRGALGASSQAAYADLINEVQMYIDRSGKLDEIASELRALAGRAS